MHLLIFLNPDPTLSALLYSKFSALLYSKSFALLYWTFSALLTKVLIIEIRVKDEVGVQLLLQWVGGWNEIIIILIQVESEGEVKLRNNDQAQPCLSSSSAELVLLSLNLAENPQLNSNLGRVRPIQFHWVLLVRGFHPYLIIYIYQVKPNSRWVGVVTKIRQENWIFLFVISSHK